MKFIRKLTQNKISELASNITGFAEFKEWWEVTVDENDMKHKIHVYHNGRFGTEIYGWQSLDTETCLESYAQKVLEANFCAPLEKYQNDFDSIRTISQSVDFYKLTHDKNDQTKQSPWAYASYAKEGPYMIIDSVHRQIGTFIDNFINQKHNFFPFEEAVCGILATRPNSSDIPEHFCPKESN